MSATPKAKRGFTLLELMVASSVFTIVVLIAVSILGNVATVWRSSSEKVEAFQGARLGFDLMTRSLSQATLNTYLDYDDPLTPRQYLRKSELQFVCGPAGAAGLPGTPNTGTALFCQAMLGHTSPGSGYENLKGGLNTCGYYVQFSDDSSTPGFSTTGARYRYRLMQLLVPLEHNTIFAQGSSATAFGWFTDFVSTESRAVADNIVACVVQPRDPADADAFGSDYTYNSKLNANAVPQPVTANQLPPVMEVTMVAINEVAASRFASGTTAPLQIADALIGKFTDADKFDDEMKDLADKLGAAGVEYRIFHSSVPILEAKWTK